MSLIVAGLACWILAFLFIKVTERCLDNCHFQLNQQNSLGLLAWALLSLVVLLVSLFTFYAGIAIWLLWIIDKLVNHSLSSIELLAVVAIGFLGLFFLKKRSLRVKSK